MKATVETKELRRALITLAKIKPTETPVTHCVHIKSEGDIVRFTVTNYEATLSIGFYNEGGDGGEHLIAMKDLRKIVSASKDKYTTLMSTTRGLVVRGYTLNNEMVEFPEHPVIEGAKLTDLAGLKKAVDMVKHAAAKEDSRPVLACINIGSIEVAAADGFRLALYAMETPFQGIYPAQYLPIVLSPFTEAFIAQDKDYLYLSDGVSQAWLRPIQRTFPDYSKIIPNPTFTYEVDALGLAHKLPVSYPPGGEVWDRKDHIHLSFNGTLRLSRPDYTADYPAVGSGECQVTLNRLFLKEALTVSAGLTTMGISGPQAPVLVTNGPYSGVIMTISKEPT